MSPRNPLSICLLLLLLSQVKAQNLTLHMPQDYFHFKNLLKKELINSHDIIIITPYLNGLGLFNILKKKTKLHVTLFTSNMHTPEIQKLSLLKGVTLCYKKNLTQSLIQTSKHLWHFKGALEEDRLKRTILTITVTPSKQEPTLPICNSPY